MNVYPFALRIKSSLFHGLQGSLPFCLISSQMESFLRKSRKCKAHSSFIHLVKQIISPSTMDKPHWLVERLSAWAVESQLWLWLSHFLFEPQFPYLYYRDIQTLFVGIEWKIKCKDMCKPPVWGLAHSWPLINRCWICPSQRALSDTLVVHCASEAVKTLHVLWNLLLTLCTSPLSLPCQPIVCDPCTISTGSSKPLALFVQLCVVCFLRG